MPDGLTQFVEDGAKRYWRTRRFWRDLIFAQVAAFILSCLLVIFCFGCAEAAGVPREYVGLIPKFVGFVFNVPLAIIGFRLARTRAQNRPQPRGFPVVMKSEANVIVIDQNRFDIT